MMVKCGAAAPPAAGHAPNAADFGSGTARAVRCRARKPMKNRVACATPLQELAPSVPKSAALGMRPAGGVAVPR